MWLTCVEVVLGMLSQSSKYTVATNSLTREELFPGEKNREKII